MKRATIILAGSTEKPRVIPWAGLFNDPGMTSAEHLDEALAKTWANDIDRDRGFRLIPEITF